MRLTIGSVVASLFFLTNLFGGSIHAAAVPAESSGAVLDIEKWSNVSISVRFGEKPIDSEMAFFKDWELFSDLQYLASDHRNLFEQSPIKRNVPASKRTMPLDIQLKAPVNSLEGTTFHVRLVSNPARSSDSTRYVTQATSEEGVLRAVIPNSTKFVLLVCANEGASHEICFGNYFQLESPGPGVLTGNSNNKEGEGGAGSTHRSEIKSSADFEPCGALKTREGAGPLPFWLVFFGVIAALMILRSSIRQSSRIYILRPMLRFRKIQK